MSARVIQLGFAGEAPSGPTIGVVSSRAFYNGREYLGEVVELGNGQFAADLPDDSRICVVDTRVEAEDALYARRVQH